MSNPLVVKCHEVTVSFKDASDSGGFFGCSDGIKTNKMSVCAVDEKALEGCRVDAKNDMVCIGSQGRFDVSTIEEALKRNQSKFCMDGKCSAINLSSVNGKPSFKVFGYLEYIVPGQTGTGKKDVEVVSASTPEKAKDDWCKKAAEAASSIFFEGEKVLLRKTMNDEICPGIEKASEPKPRPHRVIDGKPFDKDGNQIPIER